MALSQETIIGAYDAKSHFSEILARVENGEELTITKHGRPVAKLVPIKRTSTVEERESAIDRILKMNVTLGPGLTIRRLIEEGRR
jgi:prevent-host-death family protein